MNDLLVLPVAIFAGGCVYMLGYHFGYERSKEAWREIGHLEGIAEAIRERMRRIEEIRAKRAAGEPAQE